LSEFNNKGIWGIGVQKLKLLFITIDFQRHIERNTYYLSQELSKICDLEVWHQSGNINRILKQIPFKPDFILLNDFKRTRCPRITGLPGLKIPFGIIIHDIHYKPDKRREFIRNNKVKYIFPIYRDAFKRRFPKYIRNMRWLPHFVNTDIFKDYELDKDINWLMMGMMSRFYPLRRKMYRRMRHKHGFVRHSHPGYRRFNDRQKSRLFVGESYAREISRAKMFLTCDSVYHYPLIKYYEVLACKTLLLAPYSKELRALGFIPGVNFVAVNRKNFLYKAKYYLKNEGERLRIAEAGYEMVRSKHTVEIRAAQLEGKIWRIIGEKPIGLPGVLEEMETIPTESMAETFECDNGEQLVTLSITLP
jgi:hypothetical protein